MGLAREAPELIGLIIEGFGKMGDHFEDAFFSGVLRGIDGKHGGDAAMTGYLEHQGPGRRPAKTKGNPASEESYVGVLDGIQDQLLQLFPLHGRGHVSRVSGEGKGVGSRQGAILHYRAEMLIYPTFKSEV